MATCCFTSLSSFHREAWVEGDVGIERRRARGAALKERERRETNRHRLLTDVELFRQQLDM